MWLPRFFQNKFDLLIFFIPFFLVGKPFQEPLFWKKDLGPSSLWKPLDVFGLDPALFGQINLNAQGLLKALNSVEERRNELRHESDQSLRLKRQYQLIERIRSLILAFEYGRSHGLLKLSPDELNRAWEGSIRLGLALISDLLRQVSDKSALANLRLYEQIYQLKLSPNAYHLNRAKKVWFQLRRTQTAFLLEQVIAGATLVTRKPLRRTASLKGLESPVAQATVTFLQSYLVTGSRRENLWMRTAQLLRSNTRAPLSRQLLFVLGKQRALPDVFMQTLVQHDQVASALHLLERDGYLALQKRKWEGALRSYLRLKKFLPAQHPSGFLVDQRLLQLFILTKRGGEATAVYQRLAQQSALRSLIPETEKLLDLLWKNRKNPQSQGHYLFVFRSSRQQSVPLRQGQIWTFRAAILLKEQGQPLEALRLIDPLMGDDQELKPELLNLAIELYEQLFQLPPRPQFLQTAQFRRRLAPQKEALDVFGRFLSQKVKKSRGRPAQEFASRQKRLWVKLMTGPHEAASLKELETIFRLNARHPTSSEALSWFLSQGLEKKNWMLLDQTAVLSITFKVVPAQASHRPVRNLLVQARWERAREAFEKGDFETAGKLFASLQEEFPHHEKAPEALDRAAQAQLRIPDYDLGVKSFVKLAEMYPNYAQAKRVLWDLVEAAEASGQFLIAYLFIKELNGKLSQQETQKRAVERRQVRLALIEGRFSEALRELYRQKDASSGALRLRLLEGIYDLEKRHGDVVQQTRIAKEIERSSSSGFLRHRILVDLSLLALEAGEISQARVYYNQLRQSGQKTPEMARVMYAFGLEDLKSLDRYEINARGGGLNELKTRYQKVEEQLTEPCTSLPNSYCAVGLYRSSLKAKSLADSVFQIEVSSQLGVKETHQLQSRITKTGEWFIRKAKSLAQKAEFHLRYGVPEKTLFDLIFEHAEDLRGVQSPLPVES